MLHRWNYNFFIRHSTVFQTHVKQQHTARLRTLRTQAIIACYSCTFSIHTTQTGILYFDKYISCTCKQSILVFDLIFHAVASATRIFCFNHICTENKINTQAFARTHMHARKKHLIRSNPFDVVLIVK